MDRGAHNEDAAPRGQRGTQLEPERGNDHKDHSGDITRDALDNGVSVFVDGADGQAYRRVGENYATS